MFKQRWNQPELMDDLNLSDSNLKKNLIEIELTNRWFGSQKTLIASLDNLYQRKLFDQTREIIIADLGCGSGDLLRKMSYWAKAKKLKIKLIGIDANLYTIHFAKQRSQQFNNITYECINVIDKNFQSMQFDIITLNSFCHHFDDQQLALLLRQLKSQVRIAIVVNDLHRHWFPYCAIRIFSYLSNFSYLSKHDGPLSILRAFKKKELIDILQSTGLQHFRINWRWLFRWQIIIFCNSLKD